MIKKHLQVLLLSSTAFLLCTSAQSDPANVEEKIQEIKRIEKEVLEKELQRNRNEEAIQQQKLQEKIEERKRLDRVEEWKLQDRKRIERKIQDERLRRSKEDAKRYNR
jgi:hypothetical protein